jgi:hypothetical protein
VVAYGREYVSVLESAEVAGARYLGKLETLRQRKLSFFASKGGEWGSLRKLLLLWITIWGKYLDPMRRCGGFRRQGGRHEGGQKGCAFARKLRRNIVHDLLVCQVRQAAKMLQLPGRGHDPGLAPSPRRGAHARLGLGLVVGILERVRLLLPFCLQEPFLFLFPRKLVPAFRRDDTELVLTGFLTSGNELPFQKVGAEENEGIGGAGGLFLF